MTKKNIALALVVAGIVLAAGSSVAPQNLCGPVAYTADKPGPDYLSAPGGVQSFASYQEWGDIGGYTQGVGRDDIFGPGLANVIGPGTHFPVGFVPPEVPNENAAHGFFHEAIAWGIPGWRPGGTEGEGAGSEGAYPRLFPLEAP